MKNANRPRNKSFSPIVVSSWKPNTNCRIGNSTIWKWMGNHKWSVDSLIWSISEWWTIGPLFGFSWQIVPWLIVLRGRHFVLWVHLERYYSKFAKAFFAFQARYLSCTYGINIFQKINILCKIWAWHYNTTILSSLHYFRELFFHKWIITWNKLGFLIPTKSIKLMYRTLIFDLTEQ